MYVSVCVCEQFSAALCASAGALVVCVRAYACVYEGVCANASVRLVVLRLLER